MGQERSIISRKSQNTFEMLSMTWVQFVKLICELNDRLILQLKKKSAKRLQC